MQGGVRSGDSPFQYVRPWSSPPCTSMGCGASLDRTSLEPLVLSPTPGSAGDASRQGHIGMSHAWPGDASALSPAAPKGASPLQPFLKGSAIPEWLQKVAAREQQQAAWSKGERPHWEAVAAAAGATAAGGAVAAPMLLDGDAAGADPAVPDSVELAALMCGRLALPALQRLTRPPGFAVFCSSAVCGRGIYI